MTQPELLIQISEEIRACSPDIKSCTEFETKVIIALLLFAIIPADGKILESEKNRLIKLTVRRFKVQSSLAECFWRLTETRQVPQSVIEELAVYLRGRADKRLVIALIRDLWDIAVADSELHPREETLVYRLADILGIERRDVITQQARVCR